MKKGRPVSVVLSRGFQVVLWLMAIPALLLALMIYSGKNEQPDALLDADRGLRIAIDNVNVIRMLDNTVEPAMQVLIRDAHIQAIRPAGTAVDSTYQVINANGAWVLPGLFDMHAHIYDRKQLELTLSYGITAVRNMRGKPVHLRWKQEMENGDWLGSALYTASPIINGAENSNFLHKVATDPDYARGLVRRYKADGYDFLKVYSFLEQPVYEAIVEESLLVNLDITGHPPYTLFKNDFEALGEMVSIEHVEEVFQGALDNGFDRDRMQQVVQQLRDLNVAYTPTLVNFEYLTRLAEDKQVFIDTLPLEYLDPFYRYAEINHDLGWLLEADAQQAAFYRREKEFLVTIVQTMHELGMTLLVGSDAGANLAAPGIATLQEMHELNAAGLSPYAVLQAATVNAAKTLHVDHQYGTIEVDKHADLVLYRDNPLQNLATVDNPWAVVREGQWLDSDTLQALRESAKDTAGFFTATGRFLEDILARRYY